MSDFKEAVEAMMNEKGMTRELVLETIEQTLKATYKNKFKTDENAVVTFADDLSSFELASRRTVVNDEDYDEGNILEIPLSEALELSDEAEPGDELLIPIDPRSFNRSSVQTGKQRATSRIREIQKEELYSEFKGKVGEIINGYVQAIHENGDMMVDLGRTSGYLPKKNQSPREVYQKNDKIRCYVESVKPDEKNDKNIRVLLSRTHENFIKKLFYLNVPELGAKEPSLEIIKIVREPGYRTKVAVWPIKSDVDAVGTCVGLKGARIQAVMREIDDERIDVVRWDPNPLEYIANALSPAKVEKIYVTDFDKKMAVAIVDPGQLSLAIGKQGLNVRLVNRMCDWIVDVKTQEDFESMDIFEQARSAADAAFEIPEEQEEPQIEYASDTEDGIPLSDLPLDEAVVRKLEVHDILTVEEFLEYSEDELREMGDITEDEIQTINRVIRENIDIVEDEEQTEDAGFVCPNCGHPLSEGMTECPNCHVGISFESVGEDQE